MYIISMFETSNGVETNGLEIDKTMFKMTPSFTVGMLVILSVIAALYTIFW
jgi:SSS family solute:Na+ symporter